MSIYQTFKKIQSGPIMIGIAVFGILTFTITYAVNQTFARDPRKEKNMTAVLPSGKTAKFAEVDRALALAAFNLFLDFSGRSSLVNSPIVRNPQFGYRKLGMQLFSLLPWTARHAAMGTDARKRQANNEIEQVMLVNAVARDCGLEVAMAEVADWLDRAFENPEQYRQLCAYLQMTYPQFQAALREALLFKRATDLILAQAPLPTGEDLAAEWCERNERFTFHVAAFLAEARKKTIDPESVKNEDLEKWFADKNEFQKKKYEEPETLEVDGLAVLNDALDPKAALPEAFDAIVKSVVVQDSDVDTYFALARIERFKKPSPDVKDETGVETAPATKPAPEYFALEEKRAQAEHEIRVARALEKVKADAQQASLQPGFDLEAFGAKYGLTYWKSAAPQTLADLRTIPIHGCVGLVSGIADVKEGEFLAAYQPAPGALQIARLVRRTAARVPAVADLREKLLPEYVDEKAFTRAVDDAGAFRDAVEDARGAAEESPFDRVAREKGIEVQVLAPISKAALENGDVDWEGRVKDVSQYLASLRSLGGQRFPGMEPDPFVLKKGALSPPIKNSDAKAVYVVYCADRQVPKMEDMGPADYMRFKESMATFVREKKCLERLASGELEKVLKVERRSLAPAREQ